MRKIRELAHLCIAVIGIGLFCGGSTYLIIGFIESFAVEPELLLKVYEIDRVKFPAASFQIQKAEEDGFVSVREYRAIMRTYANERIEQLKLRTLPRAESGAGKSQSPTKENSSFPVLIGPLFK
jgi:hypothetical protein